MPLNYSTALVFCIALKKNKSNSCAVTLLIALPLLVRKVLLLGTILSPDFSIILLEIQILVKEQMNI